MEIPRYIWINIKQRNKPRLFLKLFVLSTVCYTLANINMIVWQEFPQTPHMAEE